MNKGQRLFLRHAENSSSAPRAQGFTLVEILVSIAILGILAAVLTTTLTGTLSLNRQSQRQLDTSARAQQLLESVRGAWALPPSETATVTSSGVPLSDFYDRACALSNTVALNGLTAQYINLGTRAQPIDGAGAPLANPSAVNVNIVANCAGLPALQFVSGGISTPYPMRRLIVSSGTGPQDVTLTLDILRPQ